MAELPDNKNQKEPSSYTPASPVKRIIAWVGVAYMLIFVALNLYPFFHGGTYLRGLAPLLVCPGAAGLAVGLALQGSLSNFASGVMLILFRPIKVGEFVEVAGTAGVVQTVQIFTTVLTTGDNKMVVVPNGTILNGTITNYSRMETRRVDMSFNLAYDVDLRQAKELLTRLVNEDPRVLKDPAPVIAVAALTDTAVQIVVRPWVKNGDYWDLFFALQERVSLAFEAEGFKRPLPQVAMHVPKA